MDLEKRLLTIEDVLKARTPSDAQIAPDGRAAAFVLSETTKEKGAKTAKSRIWLVSADGGDARPYTSGSHSDRSPRWSPDGRTLAFLSDRDEPGRYQLYLLSAAGGEAQPLFDSKGSLDSFAWSPDGQRIAYLMADPETDEEKKRKDEGDDVIEFEAKPRFTRLWIVDVATKETRMVTPGAVQVWEFAWSPDGEQFALIISDAPEEWSWYKARLARVPAAGGQPETVYTTHRQLALPLWSPHGDAIAFMSCIWSDRGSVGGDIYIVPAQGGEARNLTEGQPISVTWMEWEDSGRTMLVLGYEDGETGLFRLDVDTGATRRLWRGPISVSERWWPRYSRAADGRTLAVAREDDAHPPDIWLVQLGDDNNVEWRQLTDLAPAMREVALGETEVLRWRAPDGLEIQGLLIKPVGYEPGRRYPLITQVHGGPAGLWSHRFYAAPSSLHLLASRGFAIFLPNPRGSIGWGAAFTEANQGDLGGRDWEDIMAGIDACIEKGIADPERLGIAGGSYGGFMAAWAVTQTDRFKRAIMIAGISNWLSFHGTSNLPTWDAQALQTDPFEPRGAFERFSPITYVKRVKTPTLIIHGEDDLYVPVGQAYEFFRALKELGVETELLVYPREGHGLQERRHVEHLLGRILAWFEAMK